MANIIQALSKINRHDIIQQIQKDFLETCTNILREKGAVLNKQTCIVPDCIKKVPFIFQNLTNVYKKFEEDISYEKVKAKSRNEDYSLQNVDHQALQTASPIKERRYDKVVFLTYSSDANDAAKMIVQKLRQPQGHFKIGVLLLQEHANKVNTDPYQFIYECFRQADYVLPVLTPEYFRIITTASYITDHASKNLDNKYVKYMYTLMNAYFLNNGCKNYKIRNIIPDEFVPDIQTRSIMGNPLFQVWFKSTDIRYLSEKIVQGCI